MRMEWDEESSDDEETNGKRRKSTVDQLLFTPRRDNNKGDNISQILYKPLCLMSIDFRFSFLFTRLVCLGWIRSGDAIKHTIDLFISSIFPLQLIRRQIRLDSNIYRRNFVNGPERHWFHHRSPNFLDAPGLGTVIL